MVKNVSSKRQELAVLFWVRWLPTLNYACFMVTSSCGLDDGEPVRDKKASHTAKNDTFEMP